MMRISIFGIICLLCYAVSSCCCCQNNDEEETTQIVHHEEVEPIDTTPAEDHVDDSGYVTDDGAIDAAIEEKYGEQWDFCDCVVKNDSVNKAIDNAESDADFDRVLARMEVIDQHCKKMLTTPNTTPDEREAHNRKVRKCLKNAGI